MFESPNDLPLSNCSLKATSARAADTRTEANTINFILNAKRIKG